MVVKGSNIRPITDLKRDAAGLIATAAEEGSPIVITQNGRATAVLVDIRTYEAERETFALRALVAQSEAQIAAGQTIPLAEARKQWAAIRARRGK